MIDFSELDAGRALYVVGDVRDCLAATPDQSVDLVMTSPPFLALRSYLPADHPDKYREIGAEPDPAAFIDTLLGLTAEFRRVLAPHGSIVVELGDTYSGSGGAGGDYNADGLREGQNRFSGSAAKRARDGVGDDYRPSRSGRNGGAWPLAKSMVGIPHLYHLSLAYGRNILTGEPSPAGQWRIRNVVAWCLDVDTAVYARTPTGDRPMRLLHLHQQFEEGKFQLWDGDRWTPVLGTSTSTADDAIEIEFRNGETISCTREHQWPVESETGLTKILRADELTIGNVVPTVDLPEPGNPEPSYAPDDDIGWLCGVFLGDGSFDSRGRIQISGHTVNDAERSERLRSIAASYDGTSGEYRHEGNSSTTVLRCDALAGLIRRYINGDGARTKRLSVHAWNRSNDFLRSLLYGYLEADAHYDETNLRWRLGFTDNRWLARDLRTLGARLGVPVRVRRRRRLVSEHHVQGAPFMFRGEVRFAEPKPGRWGQRGVRSEPGEIVAIRASRRSSFIDVGVEGEPHLFALASGLLTHNCRPNPPVGALGDKFRPATSYLTIATIASDRFFDLDAVRGALSGQRADTSDPRNEPSKQREGTNFNTLGAYDPAQSGGAPPLDWWEIPTQPYSGSHYAVYPPALLERPIKSMVPPKVCRTCGEPSRRITSEPVHLDASGEAVEGKTWASGIAGGRAAHSAKTDGNVTRTTRTTRTTGWSDCGHDDWRPGIVLDPFAGSGTTLMVATGHGHAAVGFDIDERNATLASERVGPMMLETATLEEKTSEQG